VYFTVTTWKKSMVNSKFDWNSFNDYLYDTLLHDHTSIVLAIMVGPLAGPLDLIPSLFSDKVVQVPVKPLVLVLYAELSGQPLQLHDVAQTPTWTPIHLHTSFRSLHLLLDSIELIWSRRAASCTLVVRPGRQGTDQKVDQSQAKQILHINLELLTCALELVVVWLLLLLLL